MSKTTVKTKKELGVKVWGKTKEQKLSLSLNAFSQRIFIQQPTFKPLCLTIQPVQHQVTQYCRPQNYAV
jgi:hypothetical protein